MVDRGVSLCYYILKFSNRALKKFDLSRASFDSFGKVKNFYTTDHPLINRILKCLKLSNLLLCFPHFHPVLLFFFCCIPRRELHFMQFKCIHNGKAELWMERQTRAEWEKRVKNSPGELRRIKMKISKISQHNSGPIALCNLSAIWYFDTEKPDNANSTRHVYSHKYLSLHKKMAFCQFNWIMINFPGI